MADVTEPRSRARLWRGSHRGGLAGTTSFPPSRYGQPWPRAADDLAVVAIRGPAVTCSWRRWAIKNNRQRTVSERGERRPEPRRVCRPLCWRRPIA